MQYLLLFPLVVIVVYLLFTEDVIMSLFMKKLATDTSAEEIRKITDKLKAANVHYQLVTDRSRGSVGSFADARAYAKSNMAMYKFSNKPSMVYHVFVRRKNYSGAKDLISK